MDEAARQLCDVTKECLDEAIKKCGPGVPYSAIGKTIQVGGVVMLWGAGVEEGGPTHPRNAVSPRSAPPLTPVLRPQSPRNPHRSLAPAAHPPTRAAVRHVPHAPPLLPPPWTCTPGFGSRAQAIADKHKYGIVRDYVGHGVGSAFHSHPHILHYKNSQSGVMQLWETFTIEPMIVQGGTRCDTWGDNWTVVTRDRGLAAQCEHTLLITPDGAEIMTRVD